MMVSCTASETDLVSTSKWSILEDHDSEIFSNYLGDLSDLFMLSKDVCNINEKIKSLEVQSKREYKLSYFL